MFQSPHWGDNSKAVITWSDTKQPKGFSPRNGEVILKSFVEGLDLWLGGFSPRNGEIILKIVNEYSKRYEAGKVFQSPQWGDNSKGILFGRRYRMQGFSPRNGEIILKFEGDDIVCKAVLFQSPQWGDNSKGYPLESA